MADEKTRAANRKCYRNAMLDPERRAKLVARQVKYKKENALRYKELYEKRRTNPEFLRKAREAGRRWRDKNKQRAKELSHLSYLRNKQAVLQKSYTRQKRLSVNIEPGVLYIYELRDANVKIRCYWCGKITRPGNRHVDHVIPLKLGGVHSASNLCICHPFCNLSKSHKHPNEVFAQQVMF